MSTETLPDASARRRALPDWLELAPVDGAATRHAVRDDLARVLDRIDQALLLVDARCTVLHANAAARATVSGQHPLGMRDGVLVIGDGKARLAAAIDTAIE